MAVALFIASAFLFLVAVAFFLFLTSAAAAPFAFAFALAFLVPIAIAFIDFVAPFIATIAVFDEGRRRISEFQSVESRAD